jgi:hypothetical protein
MGAPVGLVAGVVGVGDGFGFAVPVGRGAAGFVSVNGALFNGCPSTCRRAVHFPTMLAAGVPAI